MSAQGAIKDSSYYSRRWLVDEGLPHNVVNRVVQDGRGFLWVATPGGLARFDGREFREFPVPMTSADASVNIRDLAMENPATLLLLPSSGGVVRLRDNVFSYHPVTSAVADKTLVRLFAEPGGALWLSGSGSTLMRWQDGRLATFGAEEGFLVQRMGGRACFAVDGDGRTWVSCGDFLGWHRDGRFIRVPVETRASIIIAAAHSGGIWISTDERLLKWEDDKLTVVCERADWLPLTALTQQMLEDRAGVLWIGTRRQGLFRLTDGKPVAVPTEHYQITALTEDRESSLWVSMDGGGINRLRPKTFALLDSSRGLPDDDCTSVCEDAAGAIWCADRRNGLVQMLAGKLRIFSSLPTQGSIYASNVCPDKDDNLWIGSINGLYQLPADRTAPIRMIDPAIQPVRSLFCTRNGDMWVGSGTGPALDYQLGYFHQGVYHPFSAADGFRGNHVAAITEASDGAVWIGNYDGEVLEFRDGKFVQRVSKDDAPMGHIHSLHFDASGALWIGSEHGLVLKKNDQLRHFTRADGLPDDLITQVLEDNRGRLWLCSRRGFFSVALDDLKALAAGRTDRVVATTFGKEEGLPGISTPTGDQPMAWKARDGRLWFVTSRGVVGFDPEASLPARPAPSVFIDQALVDGKIAPIAASLRLPAGTNRVEFRFVALNFTAPEKIRMRHQLVGFDRDWVETDTDHAAAYVRLPPGNYSIRVTACNQDGVWNTAMATLALTVIPAWWQTWWLRTAALLIFTATVAMGARFFTQRRLKLKLERLEREHQLEQERARIARDLHDDLGGSLTQIGLLADRLKRQAGEATLKVGLRKLAWRTRHLAGDLESIVWTVSPKNNTWDRLAAFVSQSARRFFHDTGVECLVEGAELIPSRALTPDAQHHVLAVVKEAMNNILKHSRATRVDLAMKFAADFFELRLRDNGVGFDPTAQEHAERNGLANMRARVAEIGGTLEIASGPGEGTELIMCVPQAAAMTARRG